MAEVCAYCGSFYGGGYCVESPTGACEMIEDEMQVDPCNCCDDCGVELGSEVLNGFVDHVCDPERKAAYQAWCNDPDDETEWDYTR